jgi:DNA polymerase/3'-5' exonuclease PolX
VTFAISIDLLAKLKFRREESISLFFKPAPDDPLIFMCPDSAAAVHQIQTVLKAHGVRGKHTNAATQKAIHEALQLVQEIQAKERALEYQPSVERVNEIMDLYRQAAERFEVAGDIRHEEVVMHMRKFLAMPQTASILDGSYQPEKPPEKETMTEDGTVPEGEVLERTEEQLEADDDASVGGHKADDDDFTKNIESVLNEAKTDLQKLNDGLDEDLDGIADDGGLDDLDAMLNAADKELEDLMSS